MGYEPSSFSKERVILAFTLHKPMAGSPNFSTYHLLKSLPFQIPLHQTFSGSIPYGKEWELPPRGKGLVESSLRLLKLQVLIR